MANIMELPPKAEEAVCAADEGPPEAEEAACAAEDEGPPEPEVVEARNNKKGGWIKHKTVTFDRLQNFLHLQREPMHGKFGGRMDQTHDATGYFYVKQLEDGGAWTFIDPEGHPFICAALNSVTPHDRERQYRDAFAAEFGDKATWAKRTHEYLFDELGINALGCWSAPQRFRDEAGIQVPYTPQLNFMLTYAGSRARLNQEGVIPVFDPDFETHCNQKAQDLLPENAEDPWLLGYFSDNELPLKAINMLQRYLALPEDDFGHQAAAAWLAERDKTADDIVPQDDLDFCTIVISRYYRIVSEALKRHDPNHLFLGSRFHGGVLSQECTFVACGPYVDVISANYYHRWTPESLRIGHWSALSGRPIMPSEWYAKGDDSQLPNEGGAGFSVATQHERGAFYQNFCLAVLRHPSVVGWHWFKYIDSAGTNAGLLDDHFHPWQPLAAAFRTINTRLYSLSDYLSTTRNHASFLDKDEIVPDKRKKK